MVVAPHHLASQAGLFVLKEGGNAIEAMLAMASTVAVVYPHMNSIGGDGFWIIGEPGREPVAIMGCGAAAQMATPEWFAQRGHAAAIPPVAVPPRSPRPAQWRGGARPTRFRSGAAAASRRATSWPRLSGMPATGSR